MIAQTEPRDPHSIRYDGAEWGAFVEAATVRDREPSVLVRECSLIGLQVITVPALMEAYVRILSGIRAVNGHGTHAEAPSAPPVPVRARLS